MQEGALKNMNFGWIFDVAMGGLDMPKQAFRIVPVAKYEFSGNWEILRKLMSKDVPKTTKSRSLWGGGRVDFGAVLKLSENHVLFMPLQRH